jgi:hypothetical protein
VKKFGLLIALNVLMFCVFGQDKKVNHGNQQWAQYGVQAQLNDELKIVSDFGFRWKESFSEPSILYFRAALAYSIDDKSNVAGGFAYFGSLKDMDISQSEYRIFQEFNSSGSFAKQTISHRLRIEERFFHNTLTDANSYTTRLRYRWQYIIPVMTFSDADKRLSLSLADEVMLNASPKASFKVFDQNRILITPILQWNKHLSTQLTYQIQYASTAKVDTYNLQHIFWLSINQKLGR